MGFLSQDLVVVLPSISVAQPARVLSSSRGGAVKVLDDRDHVARKLIEKETQRTYRLIESRATTTGRRGSGSRWWIGRITIVCQWVIANEAGRDQVLLARFSRRWLVQDVPGLARAIRRCSEASSINLLLEDTQSVLEAVRKVSLT
jgi:hypothetical protein